MEKSRSKPSLDETPLSHKQQQQQLQHALSIVTPPTLSRSSLLSTPPTPPAHSDTESPGTSEGNQVNPVKQEKNQPWTSPTPNPASPLGIDSTTKADIVHSPSTTLLCSERLPGPSVKQAPPTSSPPLSSLPATSLAIAEPAAQSLLSLSTATPLANAPTSPFLLSSGAQTSSPESLHAKALDDSPHNPQEEEGNKEQDDKDDEERASSGEDDSRSKDNSILKQEEVEEEDLVRETKYEGENHTLDELECAEHKSIDSLSASEKENSPTPNTNLKRSNSLPKARQSSTPDGKRKWRDYETSEEYERRKKARHADMNYLLDFSKS